MSTAKKSPDTNSALRGPLRIVSIGGGTGLSSLLKGLKLYASGPEPIATLTAIVTVTDDGGSSGRLRKDFAILPPGDVRNCMVALAEEEALLSQLFQYRFASGRGLKGHSFGNLFLTALTHLTGDFASAVRFASGVLATSGEIIPSTAENVAITAKLQDGTLVTGETQISKTRSPIRDLKIVPRRPKPLPEALATIAEADLITLGPGSLFTSLIPNLLVSGIPAAIVVEMIHMFSYDVDFQRDVQPGDQFEVFFNHYYTPEGEPAKSGEIMTASMTLGGKERTLYRYETPDGDEFFDAEGNSARSLLMKTPVDGARISSSFGVRRHPVLGYTRMHKGIDFAVPTGTPIMAAGNGTVEVAGRAGGYGNLLVIRHANGYSTAYGHLSRFANGVTKGARVRQGEIVAYSGMTGLATGPHLHYEIRENGTQVNPNAVQVASGRKLEGDELTAYLTERARIDEMVASLPMQTRVADAAGLRQTSEQ